MTAPVEIGQTVYTARAWSYGDHFVPCPVCYGKLFVILELGNGERVPVECEACGIGYDGPRGVVNEPCAGSAVGSFVVSGLLQRGDDEWYLFDRDQCSSGNRWGSEVFATEALAEAQRAVLYAAAKEEAAHAAMRRWEYLRKKPTWLVHYHRKNIKRAERELAWHTQKLSDARARQRTPTQESQ